PLVTGVQTCALPIYRRVDYQTTDIMRRAVTFSRIARDIVNALSDESFGKFFGEPDKNVELPIEDGRVCRAVCKASVNATPFCSRSEERRVGEECRHE